MDVFSTTQKSPLRLSWSHHPIGRVNMSFRVTRIMSNPFPNGPVAKTHETCNARGPGSTPSLDLESRSYAAAGESYATTKD